MSTPLHRLWIQMVCRERITASQKYWSFLQIFLSSSTQVVGLWVMWLHSATLQISPSPKWISRPSVWIWWCTRCHRLLASAMPGTLRVNWKNLLSAARAVWWLVCALPSSTVRPFRDKSISNLKTKQADWVYYGSGLVNWEQTNRISAFCLRFIISVGSVSLCQFAIS